MNKGRIALALAGLCAPALAAAMTTSFPAGSSELTADALRADVAGKNFVVQPAQGPQWNWQIRDNGYYYINIGSFSDSGTWNVKDSTLCSSGHKVQTGTCNEVRIKDGVLYLKRDNGEVVEMRAR